LRQIPFRKDPNLLVGAATADDAGVYRIDRDRALVLTVDFFTPIVDDPFRYGQIAAANALSDVYAMGGRPLTALNIMGIPTDLVSPRDIRGILRGGAQKALEAGCTIVGGHTIRNPEPVYGMAVTGLVSPRNVMTNAKARPGDLLLLTKPLGTGIATTGIKRGLTSARLAARAISSMRQLNRVGTAIAERRLAQAATDVTGFGLLGHLSSMCRASGVGARLFTTKIPVLSPEVRTLIENDCIPGGTRENLKLAQGFTRWHDVAHGDQVLLADAQTSGGLLLCVSRRHLKATLALLRRYRTPAAAVIGEITRAGRPNIEVHL
jgi:selenide,water dikinase